MSAHTNLSDWIARRAVMHPDKTALVTPGERYSYRRLADVIAKVSGALRDDLGVEPGDRVAYLGQNSALAVALFFACARVGAIFLPLNWRLARREHLYILADARPKALIAEAQFFPGIDAVRSELPPMALLGADKPGEGWPAIADLIEATPALLEGPGRPELPFLLCYTSGTTGRPKGAVLTQEAVLYNAINSAHMHDMTGADRILSTLPMFHVGGLNIQTSPAFHAGAEVFLHPAFDPEATIDALERERITLAVFVPAQITALLAHPRWQEADLSHLRAIATGSCRRR